jgi:nitrogen fixation NifU-like protein
MDPRSGPYGATLMEHFRRPRNHGRLPGATVMQEGTNPLCGDRIRVELSLLDGVVADARFTADACAVTIAAASILTERVRGLAVGDVRAIGEEEVVSALGEGVPPARRACAVLPLSTIVAALR